MKGVYALPGLPGIDQPDFVTVTKKVPSGVICLLSALYFHELSVQIPRWVDVAVRQSYHPPKIFHPPIHFHWFSDVVFESEVELHDLGGIEVKVYSQEKSIVDSFRLRTKIGLDVALESLKTYWARGRADIGLLRRLAERSRVLKIMSPYIESVIHGQP
jgi:predicted transcriptional regulator of viral defense system